MIKIKEKKFLRVSVQSILFRFLSLLSFFPISIWSQLYLGENTHITISEGTYIHSGETKQVKVSSITPGEKENIKIYVVEGTKITGQFSTPVSEKTAYKESNTKKYVQAKTSSKKERIEPVKNTAKKKKIKVPDIQWTYCDKGDDKASPTRTRFFNAIVTNKYEHQLVSFSDYQYKIVKIFGEPKAKFSSYCFVGIPRKQNLDYNRRGPPFLHYMNNHNS